MEPPVRAQLLPTTAVGLPTLAGSSAMAGSHVTVPFVENDRMRIAALFLSSFECMHGGLVLLWHRASANISNRGLLS